MLQQWQSLTMETPNPLKVAVYSLVAELYSNFLYPQYLLLQQDVTNSKRIRWKTFTVDQVTYSNKYTAKTYGKIIISEVYLPDREKSIKPADLGGGAGGIKYEIS